MSEPLTEPWRATFAEIVSPIEEIIEEARNGRMFILVDDEGRENEGDLVIPAQMATPEAINFMAKFGRGLICLAMTRERIDELGLPLMARKNESRLETAFTVSETGSVQTEFRGGHSLRAFSEQFRDLHF